MPSSASDIPDTHLPTSQARVGLLGTSFMGRAHSRALYLLSTLERDPAAVPVMSALCGRNPERLEDIQNRYGWQRAVPDWHQLADDPELDVFANAATNDLHAEPTIAAAQAGKHVLCEKPLGRSATEARGMLEAAEGAGVVHMCAFNYRFFPAIRLAKNMLASGELGDIYHFRSRFLLGAAADPNTPETAWRLRRETAGSGVIGDLLSHHIDLARYLVGEPISVAALTRTWRPDRQGLQVDVDDAVVCTVEFAGGGIGTLEATRVTPGHVLDSVVEIDGSKGSLSFDIQRLNHLTVSTATGSRLVDVTGSDDPFMDLWWPRGHGIGWGDSFVHQFRHFLGAVAGTWPVDPHGATFLDGYRCALICDAILAAATCGARVAVPPAT